MNSRGVGRRHRRNKSTESRGKPQKEIASELISIFSREAEIPGMLGRSPRECLAVYLFSRLAGGNLLDKAERNWRARKVYLIASREENYSASLQTPMNIKF